MARRGVRLTDAQWARSNRCFRGCRAPSEGVAPGSEARAVIDGILWVLKTGARWRDLPAEYPSPATCWRRLETLGRRRHVGSHLARVPDGARRARPLAWETAFIDGTFAPAKKGAPTSALPSAGKAQSAWYWSSVRAFLWEYASPRPRSRGHARRPTLAARVTPHRRNPPALVGDRAYDSDPLRERLATRGITLISPYRENRVNRRYEDRRRLRIYRKRWIVERTIAWLGAFRRLLVRHERSTQMFLAFFQFAAALIALRRL